MLFLMGMARGPYAFSMAFARVFKVWPVRKTAQGDLPVIALSNVVIFAASFLYKHEVSEKDPRKAYRQSTPLCLLEFDRKKNNTL